MKESLGIGRVNHILRVHGHTLAENCGAAASSDAAGCETLERLLPGVTEDGVQQAALSDKQGGLGWRQALDVARPAHLGGLIAAAPRVKSMFRACEQAGLLSASRLQDRLSRTLSAAEATYLQSLDEVEKVRAEDFIRRAKATAEVMWTNLLDGNTAREPVAPRVPRDEGEDEEDDGVQTRSAKLSAPQLQRELSMLVDRTKARRLEASLQSQGAWHQLDRLKGLRHKEVSQRWLHHLDSAWGRAHSS